MKIGYLFPVSCILMNFFYQSDNIFASSGIISRQDEMKTSCSINGSMERVLSKQEIDWRARLATLPGSHQEAIIGSTEEGKISYELDLSAQNIRGEDIEGLSPYATFITKADLSENMLDNNGLKTLSLLTELRDLNLRENSFDNDGMRYIGELTKITSLNIVYNKVTSSGIAFLSRMVNLRDFNVGYTHIGNEGVLEIVAQIPHIRNLDICSCGFDETVLDSLLKMPYLESIDISKNNIKKENLEDFLIKMRERKVKIKY